MPRRATQKSTKVSAGDVRSRGPVREFFTRHENFAFLLPGAVWVGLLYAKSFSSPFVYDDLAQILHNPNLSPWHVFVQRFLESSVAFTNDLGGPAGSTYRPVYWLSIWLDFKLWGLQAGGFHATNLVLHLANGFLGFRLLRRLEIPLAVAASASLIWLGLPINSEVVAWISGRSYSLCGLFLLLSLLSVIAYRVSGLRKYVAFYFAAALAALLSNELGILVLPFTVLLFLATRAIVWRRLYALGAASLLADAVYFGLKVHAGAHSLGAFTLNWSFALEFWKYVAWIVLPIQMSVERSTSVPAGGLSGVALAAWVGLLCLCGACVLLRRRLQGVCGGLAWMMIALLPFCGAVVLYQGMAERFTYIGGAGLVFVLVGLCMQCRGLRRGIAVVCVAVWVLWGAWRLHERVADWSDPVALYTHSLEANPHSPSLNFNLAFSLRQEGDFQGARNAYLETIALQRDYPHALTSLGELYLEAGQLDDAEREFVRAIALFPNESSAYTNLGIIFSERQLPRDAARMFSKAIENNATSPTPYFNLAVILQQAGHGDMAAPLYKKVLEIAPGDPDTLANLKKIEGVR